MTVIKEHLQHHKLLMGACGVACVAIIAAIAVGAPLLAALGAVACGAMMIGMVWMMLSMTAGRHH